jgi:hypothetical protein
MKVKDLPVKAKKTSVNFALSKLDAYETDIKIYACNNFKFFKPIRGNRSLSERHVRDLEASIQEYNLLHTQFVLVNRFGFIIDGCHKYEAARRLKQWFYFAKFDELDERAMTVLNVNRANWSFENYLSTYVALYGDELGLTGAKLENLTQEAIGRALSIDKDLYRVFYSYKHVSEMCEMYPSLSLSLIRNMYAPSRQKSDKDFKAGQFCVEDAGDFDRVEKLCQVLEELKEALGGARAKKLTHNRPFVQALVMIYEYGKMDFDKFVDKVSGRPGLLERCIDRADSMRNIEFIYNYNARNKVKVYERAIGE